MFAFCYRFLQREFQAAIKLCFASFLLSSLTLFSPLEASAERQIRPALDTPRFTLYIELNDRHSKSAPTSIADLAAEALRLLNTQYEDLSRLFAANPQRKVVLRFLSPKEFHQRTGTPSWTSAMFYHGEISIPVDPRVPLNMAQLARAIRHEYTHAVVADISLSRCPAWLDEGLAQLIEGRPNPILGPALRKWLKQDEMIPLSWLEGGFMTFEDELVAPAYAQSLFATRLLAESYGFPQIKDYLVLLGRDFSANEAFLRAFGISLYRFERVLALELDKWAESDAVDP